MIAATSRIGAVSTTSTTASTTVAERSFKTGVGAMVNMTVSLGPRWMDGSAYGETATVQVRYEDKNRYFGDPEANKSIGAYVKAHTFLLHKNQAKTDHKDIELCGASELRLNYNPTLKVYEGSFPVELKGYVGDSTQVMDKMELAFTRKGKWDSKNGKNYPCENLNVRS